MAYWLLKSEPEVWSWNHQIAKRKERWDGVRNFQAARYLKAMRTGDLCFFYHSGQERQIMGIVRVVKEAYLDPTDDTNRFVAVDVETVAPLVAPVSLKAIKETNSLLHLPLVRQSRLSVMPIDSISWQTIFMLGQTPMIA